MPLVHPPIFAPPVASLNGFADLHHPPLGVTGVGAGAVMSQNTIFAMPWSVGRRLTFTKLGASVSDAALGGNFRRGVYRDRGGDGGPGLLVADSGDVAINATGEKIGTITAFTLDPGLYWQVVINSSGASFHTANVGFPAIGNADVSNARKAIIRAFAYAALPADESAQTYGLNLQSFYMWLEN